MAIVPNLARNTDFVDQPFCSPNRVNAGNPNGSLTPIFNGELVDDTTNGRLWKAIGLTNTSWVALTAA